MIGKNLVQGLRRRAGVVVLATAGAVLFGLFSLAKLPRGIYPDVDFPRIVVVAHVGDAPPDVVLTGTTRPLEEAMITVPGMRRLRSKSQRGAAELSLQFADGTDMWRALQQVEARISDVRSDLPAGSDLVVERVTPTALPIATFNVSGIDDARLLREVATRVLRPALTRVAGVGQVEVTGGDVRELEVILRPDALASAHLTPSDIADRLSQSEVLDAVGRVDESHQVLTVVVAAEAATPEAIAALPVARGPNGPVPLSAFADVVEGAEDRTIDVTSADGDVCVVAVSRAPDASVPDVVASAQAAVDALTKSGALPDGVKIEPVYDQAELIREAMASVRDAILLGIALSLVVLAVFLRDFRAGAAAAAAVPLTLAATFGVMRLAHQSLNLMSLGGLAVAIGLVVDDAIVIVEAIVHRLEDGLPTREAAERGTADLFAAVVGTTLTTVVVFAPLGLLAGVVGSFFGALAVTLCGAVLVSLVVSVTVVPLLAERLLVARGTAGGKAMGRLGEWYGNRIRALVGRPWLAAAAIALLLLAGGASSLFLQTGFLPEMDEGAFTLDFFFPPGTSLGETDAVMRRIDHVLAQHPDVVSFTRRTGAEMGPAAATQQNRGDILVRLRPRSQRPPIDEVIDDVRKRTHIAVPEARIEFVQILQDELDDLSGNPRPIEVKVFGPEQKELDRLAKEAAEKLDGAEGLEDVVSGVEGDVPTLHVRMKPDAAARLGVPPSKLAEDLDVSLAGKVVAQIRRDDRTIGLRVRLPDDVRFDPSRLESLPLGYGESSVVALSAIADLSRPATPSVFERENMRPVVIASADLVGSDLGGADREARDRLEDLEHLPGYSIEIGGQQEAASQSRKDLATVFGLALLLVLGVLLVQLDSLRMALVVLAGAPLAIVGAVLTLVVLGIPLNASSLMGCVLLAGLVVKNGILLLEHAQSLAPELGFPEALARAGERRLRPILMTTLATIAGLFPLALGIGAGAELQRPLAVATIGGLVLSTAVTLFVLPALAAAIAPRR